MDNFICHLNNKTKIIGIQLTKIHDHKAIINTSHQSKYIQRKKNVVRINQLYIYHMFNNMFYNIERQRETERERERGREREGKKERGIIH